LPRRPVRPTGPAGLGLPEHREVHADVRAQRGRPRTHHGGFPRLGRGGQRRGVVGRLRRRRGVAGPARPRPRVGAPAGVLAAMSVLTAPDSERLGAVSTPDDRYFAEPRPRFLPPEEGRWPGRIMGLFFAGIWLVFLYDAFALAWQNRQHVDGD